MENNQVEVKKAGGNGHKHKTNWLQVLKNHFTDLKGAGWTDENLTTIDGLIDTINGHITADYSAAQKGVLDDWVDAGRLDAIIDLILADTNEVQASLADGGFTDLLIDAIKAETALIVADTGELQTDWANGGRLDLLIDAIKASTDDWVDGGRLDLLLDAIKAITDTLTLAALEAEAVDALESFDLDHLINVAHPTGDPVADSLMDLIMNKGAGQTFARATDSLEAISEAIAGIAGVNTYMEQIPDTDFDLVAIPEDLATDPPDAPAANSVVDIDVNAGDTFVLRSLFVKINSFGTGGNKLIFKLWTLLNTAITMVDEVDVTSLGIQNLMDIFGLQEVHGDGIWITVQSDATPGSDDADCEGTYRWAKAT